MLNAHHSRMSFSPPAPAPVPGRRDGTGKIGDVGMARIMACDASYISGAVGTLACECGGPGMRATLRVAVWVRVGMCCQLHLRRSSGPCVCVCLLVQGARPSCSWASTAPPRPTFFRLEFSCVSLLIGVCISLHPRPCPPPTRRHHPARSLLRRGDCHRGAAGPWAAEGAAVSAPFLWDPCLHWMALPWRCGGSSAVRAPMPARAGSACRASPCCPARCPVLPPSPPRLPLCLVLPLQGPR